MNYGKNLKSKMLVTESHNPVGLAGANLLTINFNR